MCGIAGIVGDHSSKELLFKMLDAQKHRGPDNTGSWCNDNVFLGHNRLSIIDLSEEANQPFTDFSQRYQIIFNGEIYNYIELKKELDYNFITNSDTEVLLAAYIKWGVKCLERLNGMFSFAIWDTLNKTLFAARDRFGVKPFFYHLKENTLYFSSEIKALHATGIDKLPNKKVWASYFAYGSYGMPEETFFDNINQLPGGHFLELKQGNLQIKKWYFFEEEIKKHQQIEPYKIVKKKYTALLSNSISLRFRSDVPVGFNVSGGLDSSALLAFVNQLNPRKKEVIKAYSFYTEDERYDELPWVEEMISLTKNPLEKVKLLSGEVCERSKKVSYFQDEPYGGVPTIAYAKIFEQARKDKTLVLLDGQGMDEQWAGYDYYTQNNNSIIQGVNKSPFKTNVLSKEILDLAQKPKYPKPFKDEVLNKQYRDLFYTKIPRALRFNDRVSMASSTELREPFLDYRLVEYAFAQPLEYKIKDGIQKYLLRNIVSEHLSDSISYAPKRPLQTPQREWLGNELKIFVDKEIEKIEKSEFSSWFDTTVLKQEWKNYVDGDNQSSFHIWQWLNFSLLMNS
ncbi:asparagine synthase (glutamine-hydrolyzing) [Polaribacter sp. L3A8]|uniref:asparagine synthase (glutamine-hydrolyzing) n=1 Tax=Polaribacter sp. L3A8 TaxID=2686361 RepID=UPI00131D4070|nr:asparagine synthase (glutamine-hydrolyzing) [Polaribacter sp. L3A8]